MYLPRVDVETRCGIPAGGEAGFLVLHPCYVAPDGLKPSLARLFQVRSVRAELVSNARTMRNRCLDASIWRS